MEGPNTATAIIIVEGISRNENETLANFCPIYPSLIPSNQVPLSSKSRAFATWIFIFSNFRSIIVSITYEETCWAISNHVSDRD